MFQSIKVRIRSWRPDGVWNFALALAILGLLITPTQALEVSYEVSATVPAATGVTIQAYSATPADPDNLAAVVGTNLNFGTLGFDPVNEIFLPNIFFAIDVGASGGAGQPDVNVTYSETDAGNPNSAAGANGLGHKATATFAKVVFGDVPADTVVTGLAGHGPKKLLANVNETVNETEIAPGILRIFVGVVSFDPDAAFPEPAGAEAFTTGDQPGEYFGTLVVSATVD